MACDVEGCERPRYAKGLCQPHYKRRRRHGDVFAEVPIGRQVSVCAVEGCQQRVDAQGWCHGHYQRWLRTGDVQQEVPLGRRRQPDACLAEGCERAPVAKGYCGTHYKRAVKHGDVLDDIPIRVVTGEGGYSHGYWKVPVPPELRHLTNGAPGVGQHRLVMAMHLGRALFDDEVVHHRNGDRTDNRLENLELWSTTQPRGQRVEDKVAYAVEILRRYAPELLVEGQGSGAV